MSFVEELKRRNVVRVGVAYGIAAWVLLQVADLVLEAIEAPSWVLQALMLIVGLGFIAALVIAWAYEITPEGIKKESEVDRSQSIVGTTGKKLDRIIIGFLILAVAVLLIERSMDKEVTGSEPLPQAKNVPAEMSPVSSSVSSSSAPQAASAVESNTNSIAVLPFANRSMQQEDLFFTDGIHDDLLTQLAKIKDLKVISRTSVMRYRDTQLSIPEIAAELGVSRILEGGIQRAGQRIRINAQLIDVNNDQHLWAETFDREMTMENIFDIQSEITRQIVTAVRGELTEAETASLAQRPTESLPAYEAYLKALVAINRADYVQSNYIEAEFWLNKAVELDPGYAQAWAAMVEVHGQAVWMGYDTDPARFAAAKNAMEKAMLYGPGQSETLAAEGEYLYRIENNYVASVARYQEAVNLAPGNSTILERLAVSQRRAGQFDEAITNFRKAVELDPGNSRAASLLVNTLVFNKKYAEAELLTEQLMHKFPEARDLRGILARIYMYGHGDPKSARELLNMIPPWSSNEAFTVFTELPMLERDYQGVLDAYEMPVVKALLGNRGFTGVENLSKALAYRLLGNEAAANNEFDTVISLLANAETAGNQNDAFEKSYLALAYAGRHQYEEALKLIDQSVAMMQGTGDAIFSRDVEKGRALILALAGKRDEALSEIERLLNIPSQVSPWSLRLHPEWDFFRDDERFNALATPPNLDEVRP